jgi:hypothetical protein
VTYQSLPPNYSSAFFANDLIDKTENKQILLLTDGGDDSSFEEEIAYAIEQNLQIFIFDIASKSGGSIRTENGLLKDQNKNIVHVRENPNIRTLATQTHGLQSYCHHRHRSAVIFAYFLSYLSNHWRLAIN